MAARAGEMDREVVMDKWAVGMGGLIGDSMGRDYWEEVVEGLLGIGGYGV